MANSAAHDAKIRRLVRTRDVDGLIDAHQTLARWLANQYYAPGLTHDDLTQEAMLGIAKAVRDFQGEPRHFFAFAHLCAHRQVITAVKTAQRHKHRPLNQAHGIDQPINSDGSLYTHADVLPMHGADPADQALVREKLTALLDALVELTDREYDAIIGVHYHGQRYDDVIAIVGGTRKSIDNSLQRGIRKLARAVA